MSKISQGKRQRLKQSKKLTQKLFDGMKPGEIISACKSGKWDVESLILRGEVAVLPLAKHFGLDLTQSTSDLKHLIIGELYTIVTMSLRDNTLWAWPICSIFACWNRAV